MSAPGAVFVTVPVRNEERFIEHCLLRLQGVLSRAPSPSVLSVAEDGSSDRTKEILDAIQQRMPGLVVAKNDRPLGRGLALRRLWGHVDAEIFAFIDADLATGPEAILQVIDAVRKGADVAVGSRYCPGAKVHRPPLRQVVSRIYNLLCRTVFGGQVMDHQCGLKAFSRRAIRQLLPESREDSWFWDTEMIALAQRQGLHVVEIPVDWYEYKTRRTSLRRLVKDFWLHGTGITRLAYRLTTRGEGLAAERSSRADATAVREPFLME